MAIKTDTFTGGGGGGAGTDTLDDVTGRGSSTANSITVGGVSIGTEYTLPATDGSSNQFIKTDGAGALSFAALDITGGLEYKGSYDASTNSPLLTNAEKGDFYIVSAAGTQFGRDWSIGDHLLINEDMGGVVSNGKIDKIDNTDTPASETVAGVIEIATNVEAAAATATNKALVPSNIASLDLADMDNTTSGFISTVAAASETVAGVIEIATNVEADAATATNKALVPSNISSFDLSDMNNATSGFIANINSESLNDLSDVAYTAGPGIDNYVLTYDHSTTSWGAEAAASGGLSEIVQDTTPQLGGDLDVNGNSITSAGNANVLINPAGTGDISIGADLIPDADATHTIGDEDNRYISTYSDLNGAIRFKAKNAQGAQITKGQAVYISGVSGTVPEVQLARANSASTMPAFGLVYATANAAADVEIVTFGNLTDYDTTTYSLSANDTVFISAATAGALTNTAPTGEANLIQNIGRVVRADASAGIIKAGGAGRSNATPNLDDGKIFLGNGSNQAVSTALSAVNLSSFNNDSGFITSVASASETVEGIIEIATNAEAEAATATDKALVPSNIASFDLSDMNNATSGFITNINSESLNDLSDVAYTAGSGIDNYVLTYDHASTSWGAEAAAGGGGWTYSAITADPANAQASYHYSCTGTFTITLATSGMNAGEEIRVKNMGTGTITIDPQTSTIDGSTTDYTMDVQYSAITLVSTGTNWEII